ncbi:MAG: hypothetical protein Pars92KO_32590 [Parasphingorhabdus sp.]
MKKQTPSEIVDMLQEFSNDWEVDFTSRMIQRKSRSIGIKFREFICRKKYPVKLIYRGVASWQSSVNGISHSPVIDRDSWEVSGHPEKFVMFGDWRIRTTDLKYLKNGPLIYKDTQEIAVPAYSAAAKVITFIKEWSVPGLIIGVLGIAVSIWFSN